MQALLQALQNETTHIRQIAVERVIETIPGRLDDGVHAQLAAHLLVEPDDWVRLGLIILLADSRLRAHTDYLFGIFSPSPISPPCPLPAIYPALQDPHPANRGLAAALLWRAGDNLTAARAVLQQPETHGALADAVADDAFPTFEGDIIHATAICALAPLHGGAALLKRIAVGSEEHGPSRLAMDGLAHIGSTEAIGTLRALVSGQLRVAHEEPDELRGDIVYSLRLSRTPCALDLLTDMLADPDPEIRDSATSWLINKEPADLLARLRPRLAVETNRNTVMSMLKPIVAAGHPLRALEVQALCSHFFQTRPAVQRTFVSLFHEHPAALPAVRALLQRATYREPIVRLMGVLIRHRDPLAVPLLLEHLSAREDMVWKTAAFGLGALGAVDALRAHGGLRGAYGLLEAGITVSLDMLPEACSDEDSELLQAIRQELAPAQPRAARPGPLPLAVALREARSDNIQHQIRAIEALGAYPEGIPLLWELHNTDDWEIRLLTAEALIKHGEITVFTVLKDGYAQGQMSAAPYIRILATRAATHQYPETPAHIEFLGEASLDNDPLVREFAAFAHGRITERYVPLRAMRDALLDGEVGVRAAALMVLTERPEPSMRALLVLTAQSHWRLIRDTAAAALAALPL